MQNNGLESTKLIVSANLILIKDKTRILFAVVIPWFFLDGSQIFSPSSDYILLVQFITYFTSTY